MDHNHEHDPGTGHKPNSNARWVFIGFFAVGTYFLVLEHQAHLSGLLNYLPYLLLLACPLMHIFMHGGHGGHGEHNSHRHVTTTSSQTKRQKKESRNEQS